MTLENAPYLNLPEIPLDMFLPIFLSSSAVLLFGLFYVAIYTLIKMGFLKNVFMPFAYIFWCLQAYCMYFVAVSLESEPLTVKILMMAMVGYLIIPHLWYYLNQKSEDRYEQ